MTRSFNLLRAVCIIHDLTNEMRRRLAVRCQVSEHRLHDCLNRRLPGAQLAGEVFEFHPALRFVCSLLNVET